MMQVTIEGEKNLFFHQQKTKKSEKAPTKMKFRPCIDLHSGKVKQIVGSTLSDLKTKDANTDEPATNFSTDKPSSEFAKMYQRDNLTGGHVIMLGASEENKKAAQSACLAYPNGLQIGGGINLDNAKEWIDTYKASHVIVTSFVFHHGQIDFDRLEKLKDLVKKEHLVLDLSCRKRQDLEDDESYYVVTDRWQTYTDVKVNKETLEKLSGYCDEFLVHGVEVEGKKCGILQDLVELLGEYSPIPVTYAGGVREMSDLEKVNECGKGKVDLTIGSALDCFGGDMKYDEVVKWHNEHNK